MADDYVEDKLVEWELPTLVETFKENVINKQAFEKLTDDVIKELIPRVGPRLKFIEKWTECMKKLKPTSSKTTEQEANSTGSNSASEECDTDAESDKEQSAPNDQYKLKKQRCFVGEATFRMVSRPQVREILESSLQGRTILKAYNKTQTLNRESRKQIVDLILSDVLKDLKTPLKNEDFNYISKDILQVFPTELRSTYYIPPVKKQFSRAHKSVSSRGKLVDKYRNKLRQYKRLSGVSVLAENSAASSSTSVTGDEEAEVSAETKIKLSWLETNQEPWELVQSYWKATSSYRLNDIRLREEKNLVEVFRRWPLLRHPKGYTLIQDDFESLNVGGIKNAIDNWHIFFDKVEKTKPLQNNKSGLELAKLLNTEDLSDDGKTAIQLSLLSYLIPPKGRVRIDKKHWKPSMSESKDSLLIHAKISGDVSRVQEDRVNCMAKVGLTVQPYIIVVGPALDTISSIYVSIDKVLYQVPSVRIAIDTCFKAFYTLHLRYPPESEHIWFLIQLALYKVSAKHEKKISYVLEILSALD